MKNDPTSGCYVYAVEGVEQARETWTVKSLLSGGKRVICRRDASAFGVHVMLDALCTMEGEKYYKFTLRKTADGPILAKARYSVIKSGIWYGRGDDDMRQTFDPGVAHVFPLMRFFTPDMVAAIVANGGQHPVIVPDIANSGDLNAVFAPLQSVRFVAAVEGQTNFFDLSGGAYEAPARLFVNNEGLLAHYEFVDNAGKVWTCDLI